jgi:glucose dehydrogenase
VDVPATGIPTRAGTLLTKTLLFVAEGNGTPDALPIMRAIDKNTGAIVAQIDLPANQIGLPMTYEHGGKQYLALFVGGGGIAAELVAYALP